MFKSIIKLKIITNFKMTDEFEMFVVDPRGPVLNFDDYSVTIEMFSIFSKSLKLNTLITLLNIIKMSKKNLIEMFNIVAILM